MRPFCGTLEKCTVSCRVFEVIPPTFLEFHFHFLMLIRIKTLTVKIGFVSWFQPQRDIWVHCRFLDPSTLAKSEEAQLSRRPKYGTNHVVAVAACLGCLPFFLRLGSASKLILPRTSILETHYGVQ